MPQDGSLPERAAGLAKQLAGEMDVSAGEKEGLLDKLFGGKKSAVKKKTAKK